MAKDTLEDCQACITAVLHALDGHSLDIMKAVLLSLLADVLEAEAKTADDLHNRADQVADFIKTRGKDYLLPSDRSRDV